MESNEEKLLLGCGSFFAEDSFLLSDYLHRQAERAGNRLFNNKNPLSFLRSRIFSPVFEQKEGEGTLGRCSSPVVKSMPIGQKESSESFTGKECSSHVLSELEQQKRDSASSHRTLASSDSCIESSQCCGSESAAEAATRTDSKSESLHNNMLCCQSKQAISVSTCEMEDEDGAVEAFLTTNKHYTEGLNLLVIAAIMQDNEDDVACDEAILDHLASADSPSESQLGASPVHGNSYSPILKKRVVRRAKNVFQKQVSDDATLRRLKVWESITGKGSYVAEHHMEDHGRGRLKQKGRATYAKRRKLQDLSSSPLVASVKAWANEGKDLAGNCSEEDKNQPIGCSNFVKGEFSEVGKDPHPEEEDSQVLFSKLASFVSAESSEAAHKQSENYSTQVDYRKLQISSSRLLVACTSGHLEGVHSKDRQPKNGIDASTSNSNCLSLEACKGVSGSLDGEPVIKKDKEAGLVATPTGDMKHGNSILRLKILPIRLPGADLPLFQDVSNLRSSEFATEGRMVTRKRSAQCMEMERTRVSTMMISPSMQQAAIDMAMTNTDPVMRTKRGRSQVLPIKFSDSVLQPWKSSRRKVRVLNV